MKNEEKHVKMLMSVRFKRILDSIVLAMTKKNIPVRLIDDKDVTAYTDGKRIVVSVATDLAEGLNIDLKMMFAKGQLAHEIGHIYYSGPYFDLARRVQRSIYVDIENGISESEKLLDAFYRNPNLFMHIFSTWHNILEDSYIEPKMAEVSPLAVQEYLSVMRAVYYTKMPNIEESEEFVDENPIAALGNAILQYGLYGKFKTSVPDFEDYELYKLFKKGHKEIHSAITEGNDRLRLTKILQAMVPYEDEFCEVLNNTQDQIDELMDMLETYSSNDASVKDNDVQPPTPMPGQGGGSGSGYSITVTRELDEDLEDDENSSGSQESDKEESSEENSDNDEEHGSSGSKKEEQDETDDSEDESSTGSNSSSKDDESSKESESEETKSNENDSEGQENSDDESEENSVDPSNEDKVDEKGDSEKENEDFKKKSNPGTEENSKDVNEMFSGVTDEINLTEEEDIKILDMIEEFVEPLVRQEIRDIEDEIKEIQARDDFVDEQEVLETTEAQKLLTGAHHNTSIQIIKPISDDVEAYERLIQIRSESMIKNFNKRKEKSTAKKAYSGKNIGIKDFNKYKRTKKAFKTKPKSDKSIHFTLLIDESGSMYGSRIQVARLVAVMMQRYLDNAKIDYRIVGHTEGSYSGTELRTYIDSNSRYKNDHLSLATIDDRYGNRDGLAIKWCLEKAQKERATKKILLIVSDGQPAGINYGGNSAVADMRKIISEHRNIDTYAFAIGDDGEKIAEIYGEDKTLIFSNLNDFQDVITRLIESHM